MTEKTETGKRKFFLLQRWLQLTLVVFPPLALPVKITSNNQKKTMFLNGIYSKKGLMIVIKVK